MHLTDEGKLALQKVKEDLGVDTVRVHVESVDATHYPKPLFGQAPEPSYRVWIYYTFHKGDGPALFRSAYKTVGVGASLEIPEVSPPPVKIKGAWQ
ncbi:MAG: hypothetical protein M3P49_09960 [Actinomycetota bacterium]|nr:hypothetical protein [Actinomycetota bacterium]